MFYKEIHESGNKHFIQQAHRHCMRLYQKEGFHSQKEDGEAKRKKISGTRSHLPLGISRMQISWLVLTKKQ